MGSGKTYAEAAADVADAFANKPIRGRVACLFMACRVRLVRVSHAHSS